MQRIFARRLFVSQFQRPEELPYSNFHEAVSDEAQERASLLVETVCKRYVEFEDAQDWKRVDLTSASLKFRIVRDCMAESGVKISNVDLTNIVDTATLIECFTGKWQIEREYGTLNPYALKDPVKRMFEVKKSYFPDNVCFVAPKPSASEPFQRKLAQERHEIYQKNL